MMSIHAQWMLGILDTVTRQATSGIPKDYETAISSNTESIVWSVIKMDTHNYVCDLVGLESTLFDSLSTICKTFLFWTRGP